ncbi:MAG TPA: hypothetical protein VLA48_03250 [Nitrososphaeraceae archaeon]|nr:hypothetical protein [Nitrososphaeraceae archaeon]
MHSSIVKGLVTLNGNVLTSGGAGNLAKGQLALITDKAVTGGRQAVSAASFAGMPKNQKLQFRLGRNKLPSGLRSPYAAHYETSWFTPEDIVSIKANFPKNQVQKFDSFLIGYDGINPSTALNIPEGKSSVMDITLDGKAIEVFGGTKQHTFKFHFGREVGQTTQEVVRKLVDDILETKVPRSLKKFSEFVDVAIVDSTAPALTGVSHTFSTIVVIDNGDSNDLGDIQAQYPEYTVVRTARTGLSSEYTILHPTADTLEDYQAFQNSSYIKGCADCLAGYSEIVGGVVYHVTLEDDGTSQVALVDDLPGFVTGTAVKVGQHNGKGVYSVVVDNNLTPAEIATFVATNAITATATIKRIDTTENVCEDVNTTDYEWTAGEECFKSSEQYTIQLKDNDCGETRLAELQAAYPNLTIAEGAPSLNSSQTVTVSSDVALVIIVDGVTYTTADAGTTTQTAAAFVTQHAAAISTATGVTVTNPSTNVLLFTGATEDFPTITSAAQTVGTVTTVIAASTGGCQRVYITSVTTNLVCDECSDIFLQPFTSEAPTPFESVEWTKVEEPFNADALMGIRFTGKPFNITPTEATRDEIPFYETSTRIKSIAGGYREMDYLNITPAYEYDEMFSIKRLSRAADRDALGAMLFPVEEVSRTHYLGEVREYDNLFAKANLGEESLFKFTSQYVSYDITWHDTKLSQGMGGRSNITHTHQIWVELGYHDNVEGIVNALAAKANVDIVQPTAN